MNEESFALELQNTFLIEAHEMLEETESAFIQIEAVPIDVSKIDKIFRLVHTIKGSAFFAGITELGDFAHTFGTLLGTLRENKFEVTPDVIDVLLIGNDCLKQYVNTLLENKAAVIDHSQASARIKAFTHGAELSSLQASMPASTRNELVSPVQSASSSTFAAPKTESDVSDFVPVFLICDDEPEILNLLEEYLIEDGYKVISANSAVKALAIFNSQHIDVIFTYLKMPGMNGIEFVSEVRASN
jgi:chemotaxis protein histidine kinase CheA